VGAVATQSMAGVSYGPLGLKLLHKGKSAKDTFYMLTTKDKQRASLQVAVMEVQGNIAVHMGKCWIA